MTTPTLQPQTLLALQYLFQTWKQDNETQNYALWITSQYSNNFLNALEDTEQLESNLPELNDTEEMNQNLELEDIQEETLTVPTTNQEEVTPAPLPEKLTKIIQDIIQPCGPLTQTSIPPYTGITYQEKLQKIFKRIKTRTRNRQDQTKLLEAYYYLGKQKCTTSGSIYYTILNLTTPQIKVTKAKIPTNYTSESTNKQQLSNDGNSTVGFLNKKVSSKAGLANDF
ncbi:hypothetical protein C2G38_2168386 [Gigaspora rosea]|uniref:Uncharacterized protein n=1 Tax=Gigaspora rosea TaxID=44941 RepID=A0A397VZT4_9GLOM|nr:hypothetical protein C2G38_2168386 [Gigaspora rosea]